MIKEDIHRLAVEIGERTGGGYGEMEAAGYVAGRMRQIGLSVRFEPFTFVGWGETHPATLVVQSDGQAKKIPCIAMPYTTATHPEGIKGLPLEDGTMPIIPGRIAWPRLKLTDGEQQGCIIGNPGGRVLPIPHTRPLIGVPTVIVGKNDFEAMRSLLADGHLQEAEICTYGTLIPNCVSRNVIGTLGDPSMPTIQVSAHIDTVAGSPGAVDNASGVAAMLRMAKEISEKNLHITEKLSFKFIAFGCEENYLFGSTYHAMEQLGTATPDHTVFCINFDMLGAAGTLSLRMVPGPTQTVIQNQAADYFKREVNFDTPKASTDFWPFHQLGISGIDVGVYPNDHYHLASDNMDHVSAERIEGIVSGLSGIIQDLIVPEIGK